MTLFKEFYNSFYQHPILLWLPSIIFLVYLLKNRQSTWLYKYALTFTIISLFDAWLTANVVFGFGTLPKDLAIFVSIIFVLLGDFRVFLILVVLTKNDYSAKSFVVALAWSVMVPIASRLIYYYGIGGEIRNLFVVYESLFVVLMIIWLSLLIPKSKDQQTALGSIKQIPFFVIGYYSLWVISDAFILAGFDFGFGLRVIPNFMYYGVLVPFIYFLNRREST